MTMLTAAYKSGWLHYRTEGNVTTIRAQRRDYSMREFGSERAAKAWISRDSKPVQYLVACLNKHDIGNLFHGVNCRSGVQAFRAARPLPGRR